MGMRQRQKVIDNIEDTVMENNFLSSLIHTAIKIHDDQFN